MKLTIAPGTTSRTVRVFIQDSSSTVGAGLTGLAFNSAGLTAYYLREGAAAPVLINLVTATVGTWVSGGFKEVSAANMPGWYELGLPDALLVAGALDVGVHLKGAANMAPLPLEIQLEAPIKEITGVPSATPTLSEAAMLPYMKVRNARVTDSATGEDRISNDAGSVVLEQDFTDAANVLTKSKVRVP